MLPRAKTNQLWHSSLLAHNRVWIRYRRLVAAWRAMRGAYEHHMRIDFSGYPTPIRTRQLSLFSKIIAVADPRGGGAAGGY